MASAAEVVQAGVQGFRSSALKKPVALARGDTRLIVDSEGAVRSLDSLSERRALFGRGQLYFFKVQAGVVVASQRPDWAIRLPQGGAVFSSKLFEGLEVVQNLDFPPASTAGYLRRVRLRNAGTSPIRVRVMAVSDPTGAHFRDGTNRWGALGVNAFNRETHVAMDEVSEPHPARVVGCSPGPSRFYLTTDRGRGAELVQAGDLPDSTAGMSGQVLVLSLHELEVAPSESKEIIFAWLYSPRKLEEVLSEFGRLQGGERQQPRKEPMLACSSPKVSDAYSSAWSALEGAQFEGNLLERLEVLRGLGYVEPAAVSKVVAEAKGLLRKDGLLRHSDDPAKSGVLETSLLLSAASRLLIVSGDRKAARPLYSFLRKMGNALVSLSKGGSMQLDQSLPQGWRRLIRSGFPSGEVPEVTLAASSALADFARVSRLLGKGEEAAKFRERSELMADGVGKRLVDDRGYLGLSLDSSGRMRVDETVDSAVACYRNPSLKSVASSEVHRLLEKDFETEFGPRTVPSSNKMYFHGAYGQGQLGGYWTRAALAFVCLSYFVGLPGMGSLSLEKVSRLASEESLKLGGVPGEFPYWVDLEGREVHGEKSDAVAGARFIQAVVEGELGFSASANSPCFAPPTLSTLKWVLARDLWVGEPVTIFVGRAGGKVFSFASCQKTELQPGVKFAKTDQVEASLRGVHSVSFYSPGQVVCVANSAASPVRTRLSFSGRAAALSKRLSTPLEEFEPATGAWNKIGSLRVTQPMTFESPLGPGDWKAYRISID